MCIGASCKLKKFQIGGLAVLPKTFVIIIFDYYYQNKSHENNIFLIVIFIPKSCKLCAKQDGTALSRVSEGNNLYERESGSKSSAEL